MLPRMTGVPHPWFGPLTDAEHEQGEADAGEQEPGEIEGTGIRFPVTLQEDQTEQDGHDPEGEIDEEDPPPRELGDQQAAEHRPEGGGERRRHHQDAGRPHPFGGGKARNSMAMPTGVIIPPPTPCSTRNRTSWERLSARPHRTEAPVKMATESRRISLGSEPVAQPAGRRYEHGQADQIADGHRVEGGGRLVELPTDGRQGHVDDGDVHDAHEHGRHVDDADTDLRIHGEAGHDGSCAGRALPVRAVHAKRCDAMGSTGTGGARRG